MAPATAGAVLFRSRPSAASPLSDRAQERQLKARWLLTSQRAFSLWCLPILTYTASERLVKLKLWILMAGMAA